jgi:hypothetical protein
MNRPNPFELAPFLLLSLEDECLRTHFIGRGGRTKNPRNMEFHGIAKNSKHKHFDFGSLTARRLGFDHYHYANDNVWDFRRANFIQDLD